MSESTVRGLDIIAGLHSVRRINPPRSRLNILPTNSTQLKNALVVHFANILEADSNFGGDHAAILKQLIDDIVAGKESLMRPAPVLDDVTEWPVKVLKAISAQFAPVATVDPSDNLGKLNVFLI